MYGAGAGWSRIFLPGAGADPSRSDPESAPGPWPFGAGAAQKSSGSATLVNTMKAPFKGEVENRKKYSDTNLLS